MNHIQKKIIDIIDDIQNGLVDTEYATTFFRGYVMAMVDIKIIEPIEAKHYIKFLEVLLDERVFIEKE